MKISPIRSSEATEPPGSEQLQVVCRRQLEQLLLLLPLCTAVVVYCDPKSTEIRREICYASGQPAFSSAVLEYLYSEAWVSDGMSLLIPSELDADLLQCHGYVCALAHRDVHLEYLIVFSQSPLEISHKQVFEGCAAMLAEHLALFQKCWHQQSEIQLLEQMVQRTGHQLRNPLALIGLYAENLCLGLSPGQPQEQATIIRDTVKDLSSNLTELIYCGQGKHLRASIQDLRALIDESLHGIQPLLERKCIQVSLPTTSVTLILDRLQMKQVFDNLLQNAVHFSPEGGTLSCRWRRYQTEVLIEIADQGPGLSTQDLQMLFTPYYSRRPGGTGLGLAIAKKIVLDHQGSLWAENLASGGAQFSISLPYALT